jgi:O-antigen ligase
MWLFIHRPFEVWPALEPLHVERTFMLVTLAAWAANGERTWTANRINKAFLAFVAVLLCSWLATPYGDVGTKIVEDYLKVAVFFVLVMSTIKDEESLRKVVMMFVGATFLYMLHSAWEFHNGRYEWRMGIVRMVGVDKTFSNPNAFAATILCSLPMILPFWLEAKENKNKRQMLLVLGYAGLSVGCLVLTGSRSAFVGLAVLLSTLALFSGKRVRMVLLLVICAPIGWGFLPAELQNRFTTLIDPSVGPANAQESAEGRKEGWRDGVRIWKDNPLFGVGPGAFRLARGYNLESHHLYGQVLGELGTAGAIAFGSIVVCFVMNTLASRRYGAEQPRLRQTFAYRVSMSVFLSIMLMLLMGFGGHNLYRHLWMWFGAFQAIALACLASNAEAADEECWSTDDLAADIREFHSDLEVVG